MANDYYTKSTWTARQGAGLDKFTLTESGSKTIISPSPDSVTQQGTPLSAATFNDLESRIDTGFDNVATAVAGKTAVELNGTASPSASIAIYAPTSAGAASKIPYMTSDSAWSWVDAPTAAGKVLSSGPSSPYAPIWADAAVPDGTLTYKGTWGYSSQAPSSSPAKGDMWKYAGLTNSTWMTGLTTGSCVYYDGSAWNKLSNLEIQLNGSYKASPSFYAPTSAGTYGQTLVSNGSGAPSWSSRMYSTTSIFQDSYPSSASSSLFYFTNSSNARVSGITSFVAWKTVIYNYNGTEVQKIFHIRANTNGTDFAKLHLPSGEFGTFSRMGCVLMTGDDSNAHVDYVDNLQWGNSSTTYLVFYNRSANKHKNYIIWGR